MRKQMTILLIVAGMLISAGGCREDKVNNYPFSTFVNEEGQEVGSATTKEFAAYEEAKEDTTPEL